MSDYFKNYLRRRIWYWNNKLFLRIKLQFASGDVFRRSLYSSGLGMSQISHDRLPFGQKFAFSSSHYTSGSHPQFALSVRILPVRHFAVRKLPNPAAYSGWGVLKSADVFYCSLVQFCPFCTYRPSSNSECTDSQLNAEHWFAHIEKLYHRNICLIIINNYSAYSVG